MKNDSPARPLGPTVATTKFDADRIAFNASQRTGCVVFWMLLALGCTDGEDPLICAHPDAVLTETLGCVRWDQLTYAEETRSVVALSSVVAAFGTENIHVVDTVSGIETATIPIPQSLAGVHYVHELPNDRVLVVSMAEFGAQSNSCENRVFIFDATDNSIVETAELPPPLGWYSHYTPSVRLADGRLMMVGGHRGRCTNSAEPDEMPPPGISYFYTPSSGAWEVGPPLAGSVRLAGLWADSAGVVFAYDARAGAVFSLKVDAASGWESTELMPEFVRPEWNEVVLLEFVKELGSKRFLLSNRYAHVTGDLLALDLNTGRLDPAGSNSSLENTRVAASNWCGGDQLLVDYQKQDEAGRLTPLHEVHLLSLEAGTEELIPNPPADQSGRVTGPIRASGPTGPDAVAFITGHTGGSAVATTLSFLRHEGACQ